MQTPILTFSFLSYFEENVRHISTDLFFKYLSCIGFGDMAAIKDLLSSCVSRVPGYLTDKNMLLL